MKHLVSTAALAAPVVPGNMPAYRRGEASSQFGTKPMYIKTGKLVRSKSGYSVKGTADLGDQGKKPFQCDYDKKGNFLHLKSLVDEGRLQSPFAGERSTHRGRSARVAGDFPATLAGDSVLEFEPPAPRASHRTAKSTFIRRAPPCETRSGCRLQHWRWR